MSVNIITMSVLMMKERTSIHSNIDEKLIYPDMKYVQDSLIKPVLGTALFEKIQTLIAAGTITDLANADYKYLIDTYIVDAMMYFTLSKLPMSMGYQFWNKGVVRKTGDNTELPSMSDLIDISNEYKSRGEYYANRLEKYLLSQAGLNPNKYPEYYQPGNTVDTVYPSRNEFTSPIYLGDDRDNPYCNPGGFNGQPYKD